MDKEEILTCVNNLAGIASERALTNDWEEHPMFGILSSECTDRRAKEFQEEYKRLEVLLCV